jgi:lysophospholipase L1-like esterase
VKHLAFLGALAFAGCGGGGGSSPGPLPAVAKVVVPATLDAIGDSISFGIGTTGYPTTNHPSTPSSQAFPMITGADLGATVTDLGLPGAGVPAMVALEVPMLSPTATYVTIYDGTNDVPTEDAPAFQAAHLSLLQAVRAKCPNAKIAVVDLPDILSTINGFPGIAPYDAAIRANTSAIGGILVDIETDATMNSPADYIPTGGHPTTAGAAYLGNLVAAAL